MYSSPNSSPKTFSPSCLSQTDSAWSEEDEQQMTLAEAAPISSSPPSSPGCAVTPPMIGSDCFTQVHSAAHTPTEDLVYASQITSDPPSDKENCIQEDLLASNRASPDTEPSLPPQGDYISVESSVFPSSHSDAYLVRYSDLESPRSRSAFHERLSNILTEIVCERQTRIDTYTLNLPVIPEDISESVSPLNALLVSPVFSVTSSGYDASDSSCSGDSCSTVMQSPTVPLLPATASDNIRNDRDLKTPFESDDTEKPSACHTPSNSKAETCIIIPDAPKKVQHTIRIAKDTEDTVQTKNVNAASTYVEDLRSYGPGSDDSKENKQDAYNHVRSRSVQGDTEDISPPLKKRKVVASRSSSKVFGKAEPNGTTTSHVAPDRFASRRASLRKAASLVSESSFQTNETIQVIKTGINPVSPVATVSSFSLSASNDGSTVSPISPKTEPVTPVLQKFTTPTVSKSSKQRKLTPLPDPLPIIAPPPYVSIPRAPASAEEIAEICLKTMLEKEQGERFDDGLDTKVAKAMLQLTPPLKTPIPLASDTTDDDMTDDEKRLWKDLSDPDDEFMHDSTTQNEVSSPVQQDDEDEDEPPYLCIEDEFRQEVVEWMLDTIPPAFPAKPQLCRELRTELTECMDTRWHAVQLFIRYFVRIGASPPCSPAHLVDGSARSGQIINTDNEKAYFIWDIAVACLAIAVKFHRDVLYPLVPVFAEEFTLMARHLLTYDDFETAQRHVLSAFDFCIGSVTPGVYMEELWNALPSLRALLDTKTLWETAKKLTWEILSDTLFDIDYVRYRTSTLTACALVRGISEALIIQKKEHTKITRSEKPIKLRRDAKCTCAKISRSVLRVVRPVELDMLDILKVNEKDWIACKEWLTLLDC